MAGLMVDITAKMNNFRAILPRATPKDIAESFMFSTVKGKATEQGLLWKEVRVDSRKWLIIEGDWCVLPEIGPCSPVRVIVDQDGNYKFQVHYSTLENGHYDSEKFQTTLQHMKSADFVICPGFKDKYDEIKDSLTGKSNKVREWPDKVRYDSKECKLWYDKTGPAFRQSSRLMCLPCNSLMKSVRQSKKRALARNGLVDPPKCTPLNCMTPKMRRRVLLKRRKETYDLMKKLKKYENAENTNQGLAGGPANKGTPVTTKSKSAALNNKSAASKHKSATACNTAASNNVNDMAVTSKHSARAENNENNSVASISGNISDSAVKENTVNTTQKKKGRTKKKKPKMPTTAVRNTNAVPTTDEQTINDDATTFVKSGDKAEVIIENVETGCKKRKPEWVGVAVHNHAPVTRMAKISDENSDGTKNKKKVNRKKRKEKPVLAANKHKEIVSTTATTEEEITYGTQIESLISENTVDVGKGQNDTLASDDRNDDMTVLPEELTDEVHNCNIRENTKDVTNAVNNQNECATKTVLDTNQECSTVDTALTSDMTRNDVLADFNEKKEYIPKPIDNCTGQDENEIRTIQDRNRECNTTLASDKLGIGDDIAENDEYKVDTSKIIEDCNRPIGEKIQTQTDKNEACNSANTDVVIHVHGNVLSDKAERKEDIRHITNERNGQNDNGITQTNKTLDSDSSIFLSNSTCNTMTVVDRTNSLKTVNTVETSIQGVATEEYYTPTKKLTNNGFDSNLQGTNVTPDFNAWLPSLASDSNLMAADQHHHSINTVKALKDMVNLPESWNRTNDSVTTSATNLLPVLRDRFAVLAQKVKEKGTQRAIRRSVYPPTSPIARGITWQWESDILGRWNDFDVNVATHLEENMNKNNTFVDLTTSVFNLPYQIDLKQMTQTRVNTGRTRKIRRNFTSVSYSTDTGQSSVQNGVKRKTVINNAASLKKSKTASSSGSAMSGFGPPPQNLPLNGLVYPNFPSGQGSNSLQPSLQGGNSQIPLTVSQQQGPLTRNKYQAMTGFSSHTSAGNQSSTSSNLPGTSSSIFGMGSSSNPIGQLPGSHSMIGSWHTPTTLPFMPGSSSSSASQTTGFSQTSGFGLQPPGFLSFLNPAASNVGNQPGFSFGSQPIPQSFNPSSFLGRSGRSSRVRPSNPGASSVSSTGQTAPNFQQSPFQTASATVPSAAPFPSHDRIPNNVPKGGKGGKQVLTADDILHNYVKTVAAPPANDDCCICYEKLMEASGQGTGGPHDRTVLQLERCSHMFHKLCLDALFNSGPKDGSLQCPSCKTIYGEKMGNCPRGEMEYLITHHRLAGYEDCNSIQILYHIHSGIQGPEHPHPGQRYSTRGFPRIGYLPNNEKGRKILQLLIIAWKRRLTFTIGTSTTTGEGDTVTWNEIHHKTEHSSNYSGHGYPDPKYLDNVLLELAVHGITEKDLPT